MNIGIQTFNHVIATMFLISVLENSLIDSTDEEYINKSIRNNKDNLISKLEKFSFI